jgi:dihydroflavonol-4-reductase
MVLMAAYTDEIFCRWITHRHPTIPVTGVKMARKHMYFDCAKAVRELKLPRRKIEHAMTSAVNWYIENGYVKP